MNYAKLFKAIIEDECKNKEDLIKAGYTLDEINLLLSKGIITLDNGLSLTPIAMLNLYNYAKYIFKNGNRALGIKYLEYAYNLYPNDMDYLKELFLMCLYDDKEKAFIYFDKLYHGMYWKGKNHFTNQNDINFILLLFSYIKKLPDEYKVKAENLMFDEIKSLHPNNNFSYTMNKIRGLFYSNSFYAASNKIAEIPNDEPRFRSYALSILKTFNYLIKGFDIANRNKVEELIRQNRYEEAYELTGDIVSNYRCDKYYSYVHKLLGIILGKIEVIETDEACVNVFDALDKNNFKEAERLSNENSVIRILTEEIIDAKTNKNLYDDFVDNLMSGQIDKSLAILNKYLISLSKSDYEDLLVRVIKYNEHIGDKMHANVMLALNMIKMNDFRMDLTECYKEFYKRVNMRDFIGAKLLLEIIKEAAFVLRKEADINSLVIMLNDACKYDKYFDALNNDKLMITIPYNKDINGIINEAKIRGIKYTIIGEDENKRLILVRTIKIDNDKLKELFSMLDTNIKQNDFKKALNVIEKIIAASKIDVSLLIKYTIILNELGMKKEALEVFNISKDLASTEEFVYDFDGLLTSINNKPSEEDKLTIKQIVNFDKEYEHLFDMVSLKVSDEDISVTKACASLGFDTFNTGMVLLIYAKRYYMAHNEKKGNEFINKFNRLPLKDAKLKEYYQSVLSMRSVYLNKEISQNNMVLVKA